VASLFSGGVAGAVAGSEVVEAPRFLPSTETWVGGDVSSHVWLAYSGVTVAPFGNLWSDGWRLRMSGSHSRYVQSDKRTDYAVQSTGAQLMAGYQVKIGDLTSKVLAGASFDQFSAVANDGTSVLARWNVGAAVAIEEWLDIGDSAWASLDLSAATNQQRFSVRGRLGLRIDPAYSVGPELRLDGSRDAVKQALASEGGWLVEKRQYLLSRAGLFGRFQWSRGEVSVSGGVAKAEGEGLDGYVTVNASYQY
jgi:hypothetical protein